VALPFTELLCAVYEALCDDLAQGTPVMRAAIGPRPAAAVLGAMFQRAVGQLLSMRGARPVVLSHDYKCLADVLAQCEALSAGSAWAAYFWSISPLLRGETLQALRAVVSASSGRRKAVVELVNDPSAESADEAPAAAPEPESEAVAAPDVEAVTRFEAPPPDAADPPSAADVGTGWLFTPPEVSPMLGAVHQAVRVWREQPERFH
jgi:hypothetical protein